MVRYLVTGTAGFIGFHVANRLLDLGHAVTGVDGMTPYYDVKLKEHRHDLLRRHRAFDERRCMLEDREAINRVFEETNPEGVIHLAAQAGVRYSIENPAAYIDSNVVGSFNILEGCRRQKPRHLLVASTSSVYGASTDYPLAETGGTDWPLTLYAASKKSLEVMAHSYAHLWDIPTTVFRFFTVYGPWGRPDMALFKFVRSILADQPIDVYNHGKMERDFTYVDDLVEAIVRLTDAVPGRLSGRPLVKTDSTSTAAPYRIVNIGGRQPVTLMAFIEEIEQALGKKATRNYLDMQLGDVSRTEASTEFIEALINYRPSTPLSVGIRQFIRWYREYYQN